MDSLLPLFPRPLLSLDYTEEAMNAVSVRGDWVGQVIDGRYPLLEWLGGSGTSGTFLTELDGLGSRRAAVKLIPSSPQSEDRLAGWVDAAKLSHPHLAEIHHYGRAEVSDVTCVYIVYDLAEELLSQIIPERALTTDEARQMLDPILGALDYLHNAGYAHGHLKPSNVLVVENEIKISSDGLLPVGKPAPELLTNDIHIAPEIATGAVSPRTDIWSLGITLVEALTQQLPIWDAASDTEPVLPATIPAPFAEIARRCLHTDPLRRCAVADIRNLLEAPIKPAPAKPVPPPLREPDQHRLGEKPLPSRMPFLPLVIGLVLLVAIIVGLRLHSRGTNPVQPPAEATRQAPATEPDSKPTQPEPETTTPASQAPAAAAPVSPSTSSSGGDVLNRDVPDVPRRASDTIHGTVGVVVRVNVDPSGAVTNAEYATHGPSAYFARIALESARNWKFKPPQQNGRTAPSTWLLHYKFRRGSVEVTPNQANR
jgi:TonB family protein